MKLFALEEKKEPKQEPKKETIKGTYLGVRFSPITIKDLLQLQETLQLPNPTPEDELHSTVIYSRVPIPDLKEVTHYPAQFSDNNYYQLHVFNTKEGKRALVILTPSKFLSDRHKHIMDNTEATYDFDEYVPHITLSYDIGEMKLPEDKIVYFQSKRKIEIIKEYVEELDLEWKPTN